MTYETAIGYDGPVTSADVQLGYTITPSSVVRVTAGLGEQNAEVHALANTTHWIAVNYYRDLPFGFSAGSRAGGPLDELQRAARGVWRHEIGQTWAIRLDLLNRRLEYRGFAPRLSFIYVNQASNIELYRYSRSQIQLGLTRQF